MPQENLEIEDDTTDENGDAGREALEEAQAEDGEAPTGERPPRQGPFHGPREREGRPDGSGNTEGGSTRPGVGDGDVEIDLSPVRGGSADSTAGSDAIQPAEPVE